MIEHNTEIKRYGNLYYKVKNKKPEKCRPWIGDIFSGAYDSIMKKSVFPRKFAASQDEHFRILKKEYSSLHNCRIIELASGSGSLASLIPPDNTYAGTDISGGLLRIAYRRFAEAGIKDFRFYVCSADSLPFNGGCFDCCICNLSFNFFPDLQTVINEARRVLKTGGCFLGSIPLPEKTPAAAKIRGTLLSEPELAEMFRRNSFEFIPLEEENGALLYFKAAAV